MVHEAAAVGYQRRSEAYIAGRPGYHPEVLAAIVASIDPSLGTGLTLELGAGTGIATTALVDMGLTVRAVEPVAAMRARLSERLPDVDVRAGSAEEIPASDASVAAVVVAQAFHWFDGALALNEIARVLDVHGCLITLWNVRDESVPWMAAYTAIQDTVQGDTPRYRDMRWRRAIESDQRFELVNELSVDNPHRSNPDHTVSRFLSTSFIAALDQPTQTKLEAEVRDLVAGLGETYDFPYTCETQIWKRRPGQ